MEENGITAFKVIGRGQKDKYMDETARKDVISYMTRPDKAPHHYIGGIAVNIDNAAEEMTILADAFHKDDVLRLRHSVIGFDKDKDITLETVNAIARATAEYFGSEYQTIYAVHEDAEHIHAHLVMNSVSYLNGRKYHGTKKEYYDFLKYMKRVVRSYGIPFIPVKDE